ncbi:hypothetical protein [Alloprevotella tannerae]|uniref:hypothetical protein n=1 Tax=Alloprevotella tannerae TaxID=76122 RepID=UPI0025FAE7C4|nr:hypothetical protein [Alloprevotella tannerae]
MIAAFCITKVLSFPRERTIVLSRGKKRTITIVQINDETKDFRNEMKGGRKTEEDAQEFALTLHHKEFTRT